MKFKPKLKFTLAIAGTLLICFGLGFGMGAVPDQWRHFLGRPPAHLKILLSDAHLIPTSLIYQYEKISGHPLQVETIVSYHLFRSEVQNADLLFAPLAWLGNFHEVLKPLPGNEQLRFLLDPDFSTLPVDLLHFFPVLWKVQSKSSEKLKNQDTHSHLILWGFATASSDPPTEAREFLIFILSSPERVMQWSDETSLSSTLQISNSMPQLNDWQRAHSIRQVPLDELKIDHQFGSAQETELKN